MIIYMIILIFLVYINNKFNKYYNLNQVRQKECNNLRQDLHENLLSIQFFIQLLINQYLIIIKLIPSMDLSAQQIARNIQALKNKIGDARTGGKGSQRRKVKVTPKPVANDDKKIKTIVKKLGVQPLQAIDEVNFFKDDNTVVHFQRPDVLASVQSNTFVIIGNPETKTIKDLLPDVIQQLGPKQFATLKDLININNQQGAKEQQAPTLVPTSFEDTAKVQ